MKKFIVPILGVMAFYIVVFILGNETTCFYRNIFGMPCPGCGLTRAYTAFFKGDIIGALSYHPLFIIPAIVAVVIIFRKKGFMGKIYKSKLFWNTICILLIGLWAIRMIAFFPNREPMTYYKDAFIPRIIRALIGTGN